MSSYLDDTGFVVSGCEFPGELNAAMDLDSITSIIDNNNNVIFASLLDRDPNINDVISVPPNNFSPGRLDKVLDMLHRHRRQYIRAIFFKFNIPYCKIPDRIRSYVDSELFPSLKPLLFNGKSPSGSSVSVYRYRELLNLFVLNLYESYRCRVFLAVRRNAGFYSDSENKKLIIKPNHRLFSITMMNKVIDALISKDLVFQKKGFIDPDTGIGLVSRYYARNDLLKEIQRMYHDGRMPILDDVVENIIRASDERVLVRDTKRKGERRGRAIPNILEGVAFPEKTKQGKLARLKRIKGEIDEINKFLRETEIILVNPQTFNDCVYAALLYVQSRFLLKLKGTHDGHRQYLMLDECKRVHRVFNDASITMGGRLYGRFQQFNWKTRLNFLMNGEQVELIDISSSHVRMLYHMCGFDFKDDAYQFLFEPGVDTDIRCKIVRKINKKLFQTIINARSFDSAVRSALGSIKGVLKKNNRKDIADQFNSLKHAEEWICRFAEFHEKVKEYFYTGQGIFLQYIESEIIKNSMLELWRNHKVPSLPVHDELIVPFSKRELAKGIIEKNYRQQKELKGFEVELTFKRDEMI